MDILKNRAIVDLDQVVRSYAELDVPTVLRMRDRVTGGMDCLFAQRMRRMQALAIVAMNAIRRLIDQPRDAVIAGEARIFAQRAMEIGYRVLEVSDRPLAIAAVSRMATDLGVALRTVARNLPASAPETSTTSEPTRGLDVDGLLSLVDGLAVNAPMIAERYDQHYRDVALGRNLGPSETNAVDQRQRSSFSPGMTA